MASPGCYTIDAFAEHVGCSRAQVYNLLKARRLNARKLGAKTVIVAEEAERFIRELPAYDAPGVRFGRAAA